MGELGSRILRNHGMAGEQVVRVEVDLQAANGS